MGTTRGSALMTQFPTPGDVLQGHRRTAFSLRGCTGQAPRASPGDPCKLQKQYLPPEGTVLPQPDPTQGRSPQLPNPETGVTSWGRLAGCEQRSSAWERGCGGPSWGATRCPRELCLLTSRQLELSERSLCSCRLPCACARPIHSLTPRTRMGACVCSARF